MKKNNYKVLASEAGIMITPSEDDKILHEFINNAKDVMQFDYRTVDEKETGKRSTAYGDASTCQASYQPKLFVSPDSMKWFGGLALSALVCIGTWLVRTYMSKNYSINNGGGNSAISEKSINYEKKFLFYSRR